MRTPTVACESVNFVLEIAFQFVAQIWSCDEAQGIAEYAIMLAAILLIVIGVLRLLGATTNDAFSTVARIFSADRD
jgi:Flp pilus assembly pilin Flp